MQGLKRFFKVRLNIRTRMLLLCVGVAAPLLAIGSFSLWKEYRTLRNEATRATTFQAAIATRTLSQWVTAQTDAVAALAAVQPMQQLKLDTVKRILFTALKAQSAAWTELTLFSLDGDPLVTTVPQSANRSDGAKLSIQDFIARTLRAGKPTLSGYERSPITGKPALLVAAPVVKNGQLQAILVATVDPKAVLRIFLDLGETNGNIVCVVDSDKRVIARTLQNDYFAGKDFSGAKTVRAAQKADKGTFEAVGIADPTPRAYAFEHLKDLNWVVIVGVPTESIYGAAHDWLVIMVVLAGCAIGVSVVLAYWATNHFTSSIHLLMREAMAIGRGDLSKRVSVPARDELGLLARAFNQMAERLEMDHEQKAMVERISESIRQSLDLDDILNTTVTELCQALSASRCCLALVDNHNTPELTDDELVFNYVSWEAKFGGSQLNHRSILITEHSMMRTILEQGSILSLDVLDEEGPTPLFENSQGSPDDWKSIRSLIACPITTKEGPLGLILVHQCDRLRQWTDSELELVEAITSQVTLAMEHARLYNRTKTMAEQEILINHIVRSVRSSLDLDTILGAVTKELVHALGADRVQIAQPRSEGPLVVTHEFHHPHLQSCKGLNLYPDQMDFHPNMNNSGQNTLLGISLDKLSDQNTFFQKDTEVQRLREDDTLTEAPLAVIANVFQDSRALPFKEFLDQASSQSLIAAPLLNDNRLVGVLMVHQCTKMRNWTPHVIQLVAAIADQVAIAITHAHLFAQVKYQAITDGLTGLYNHIYFKNRLAEEIRLAQRKNTSCSLLMIDLDKLKLINDKYGHPIGDAAIRQISSILKTLLRSGDTAARYGGEEFGIILPETSLLEAALIADRLCSQIRNTPVPGLGRITASIGAATFPKHADGMADLVEKADKALYVAKNSGRDQVRLYEDEQAPAAFPTSYVWSKEHESPQPFSNPPSWVKELESKSEKFPPQSWATENEPFTDFPAATWTEEGETPLTEHLKRDSKRDIK